MLYSKRMSSPTRDTILKTLRMQGHCTVKELAKAVDISPISVRHHLSSLQAEGLVAVEEARHGVGRPYHLYSLTDKGLERFPRRYYLLTDHILKELKDALPEEKLHEIFTGVATSMSDARIHSFEGLNLQERIKHLSNLLSEEGFEVEIERKGDELLIHELSCPYLRIGKSHPEVCMIDQTFIANALEVPVERITCILKGDTYCTFSIQLKEEEGL
jgi:DeoR family suf operon transcriptional repressor